MIDQPRSYEEREENLKGFCSIAYFVIFVASWFIYLNRYRVTLAISLSHV
jgi:hypothetical protein